MKYWLKSSPTFTPSFKGKVDRNAGIIRSVKMVSMGEAKGHGVYLNSEFIDAVVEKAQSHKNGVRSRFGHPNMCNEALGTFLGVYKNVRREEDSAVGDLYLSDTSKNTPNGDLYNYVIDLAEKEPESFGSSIVFEGGSFEGDLNGKTVSFATIETLEFTDLVGEPAATDGLFSINSIAETVTNFLEENPSIFEAYEKKPQILQIFLNKYKMFKLNKKDKSPLKIAKFKSGEQVAYYGEMQEGTEISPVELETLPDGDYILDDGRMITVANGTVTAVKPAEQTESPDFDSAMSALTAELTNVFNEGIDSLRKEFDTKIEELRKKGSSGEPPKGKGGGEGNKAFNVHASISKTVKDLSKNIKQKMEG